MPVEKDSDEFFEMVQRFIHLRPKMVVPDNIARFKQHMQNCKPGGVVNPENRAFIFRIFIILERTETPPTMGELSTKLEIPFSSATRIIDGLLGAKFIERAHDVTDRRVVRVQMKKIGKEFYQTAREFNKQKISRMLRDPRTLVFIFLVLRFREVLIVHPIDYRFVFLLDCQPLYLLKTPTYSSQ